jgi:hypothetical protein
MITLYSKGDYDFVKIGGPWIYKQNALIVKDFDSSAQPSEIKLDAVPVWMKVYDVPFRSRIRHGVCDMAMVWVRPYR